MFNLGSKEILIIALIILFLFGSKKLTEWAKGLGDAGRELKKAKKEFSDAIDETDKDIKKTFDLNEAKPLVESHNEKIKEDEQSSSSSKQSLPSDDGKIKEDQAEKKKEEDDGI